MLLKDEIWIEELGDYGDFETALFYKVSRIAVALEKLVEIKKTADLKKRLEKLET